MWCIQYKTSDLILKVNFKNPMEDLVIRSQVVSV